MSDTHVQITVPGGLPSIVDVTGHTEDGTASVELYLSANELHALAYTLLAAASASAARKGTAGPTSSWTITFGRDS